MGRELVAEIRGRVATPDASWSFLEPVLTTGEAIELGAWLGRAASGEINPATDPGLGGRGGGFFVEPNIWVRVESAAPSEVSLVWSFAQESTRPGAPEKERFGDGTPVHVTLSPDDLRRAVDDWSEDLQRFPVRRGRAE